MGSLPGASVSITDSKVEKDVIAGQAGVGTVANSKVEIGGDDTVILGTVSAGKVDEGKVTQAKVTLAGGTVNVIKGGFAKAGEAVANVVDLIKGEVDTVFGGNVESGGKSEGNIVNLLGAKVRFSTVVVMSNTAKPYQ